MDGEIIKPPHVRARFERRWRGFENDLRRMGFTISSNCGYRMLDGGDTYIILDFVPYLSRSRQSRGESYPERYWPAWCRVLTMAEPANAWGWDNFAMAELKHHVPDVPPAREREEMICKTFGLKSCRPWRLLRHGYMKGPPHFEDFVLEWTSPLSTLIAMEDRKAGWEERWKP